MNMNYEPRNLGSQNQRILKEKYERHTKIYTDGSKKEEKVGYELNIKRRKVGDHKRYKQHMEKRRTEGDNHGLFEYNYGCVGQKTDEES
jgi:hypothetical protein